MRKSIVSSYFLYIFPRKLHISWENPWFPVENQSIDSPAGHVPSLRTILEKPQHPDGGPGALHAAARYGHAEAEFGMKVGGIRDLDWKNL